MTILIVYHMQGKFFGEIVDWKRSGSGSYRELTRVEIPQTKEAIELYAAEHQYKIEWRTPVPEDADAAAAPATA
jgi:hypothetical protein